MVDAPDSASGGVSICWACARRLGLNDEWRQVCEAFPDGIPRAIQDGYDHRREYPGDQGLTFVLDTEDPDAEQALADYAADRAADPLRGDVVPADPHYDLTSDPPEGPGA